MRAVSPRIGLYSEVDNIIQENFNLRDKLMRHHNKSHLNDPWAYGEQCLPWTHEHTVREEIQGISSNDGTDRNAQISDGLENTKEIIIKSPVSTAPYYNPMSRSDLKKKVSTKSSLLMHSDHMAVASPPANSNMKDQRQQADFDSKSKENIGVFQMPLFIPPKLVVGQRKYGLN